MKYLVFILFPLFIYSQEDLFKELEAMVKDGSIVENSEPVDMDTLEEEDPELYEALINADENLLQ